MNSNRYSRHTSLKNFGAVGQAKLASSQVLVVGLGGLGLPAVQYLNAMGIGTLGLVENDIVELHNLQRQVLYTEKDIGKPKIEVVLAQLKAQNSETKFKAFHTFLTPKNALEIIADYDVVVDATDNFATRYLINDACVILNKPVVYGALHNFEGQVSVFNYKKGPTYRCLFPKMPSYEEIPNCDINGVLGVLPGIIGNLQALEVVKIIAEIGEVLTGKLLLYDGLSQHIQKINFPLIPKNKEISNLKNSYGFTGCDNFNSITAEALLQKLTHEKALFIDVRTPQEFEDDHLDAFINIPLDVIEETYQQINANLPIYVLCQSGKRSEIAVLKLQEKFSEASIFNVIGGMNQIQSIAS